MKILSFSCVEKLPALLRWRDEKLEWQTIRPAWKLSSGHEPKPLEVNYSSGPNPYPSVCPHCGWSDCICSEPRFEVDENVQLMWKQRSQSEIFCKGCGQSTHQGKHLPTTENFHPYDGFMKRLGTGPVTEVFKIEMFVSPENVLFVKFLEGGSRISIPGIVKDLAVRDGFSSTEEFRDYFNKSYQFSKPLPFYVYRGSWL